MPIPPHPIVLAPSLDRRAFLKQSVLTAGILAAVPAVVGPTSAHAQAAKATRPSKPPTKFIHACMTLPYAQFPLVRALSGIKAAGYDHVAWGIQHLGSDGQSRELMPVDASPDQAGELGRLCRDFGLEPVKMFARVRPYDPNAIEGLTHRIRQAGKAGIAQVMTYGHPPGQDPTPWVKNLKQLGPIAADHNVLLVVKQHGGAIAGSGEALAKILRAVDHPNVQMSYDAGNIAWYLNIDPVKDIATCADLVRGFCVKDHRHWPIKTTPGPGHGEIDHYRLFAPVAFTGLTMILAYERIEPSILRPRPPQSDPAVIDGWARSSREFIQNVITGLQATLPIDQPLDSRR